jgi:hypothetical protein
MDQDLQLRTSASRLMVPAFQQDRTSICCLRLKELSQMIECVFSATLETTRKSIRSRNSFAQSPTCETWQPAL